MTENNGQGSSAHVEKSSTGLDENVAGLLTYSLGVITGILFLVLEKDSRYVRYHALQSIFLWLVIIVINMFIQIIPLIGFLFSLLFAPVAFVIWIVCMYKAYKGQWFKVPVIGKIAEQQLGDFKA